MLLTGVRHRGATGQADYAASVRGGHTLPRLPPNPQGAGRGRQSSLRLGLCLPGHHIQP